MRTGTTRRCGTTRPSDRGLGDPGLSSGSTLPTLRSTSSTRPRSPLAGSPGRHTSSSLGLRGVWRSQYGFSTRRSPGTSGGRSGDGKRTGQRLGSLVTRNGVGVIGSLCLFLVRGTDRNAGTEDSKRQTPTERIGKETRVGRSGPFQPPRRETEDVDAVVCSDGNQRVLN